MTDDLGLIPPYDVPPDQEPVAFDQGREFVLLFTTEGAIAFARKLYRLRQVYDTPSVTAALERAVDEALDHHERTST